MADFGYMTVTTTCPVVGADGNTDTRVFGEHGTTVYKQATCPEGHVYTVGTVVTVSGVATAYEID